MGSCLLLKCISRVVSAHKSPSPSGTAGFVLSLLGMIERRHRVNRLQQGSGEGSQACGGTAFVGETKPTSVLN